MDQKNRGYLEIFGELQSPTSAGLKGFPCENSSRQIKQNHFAKYECLTGRVLERTQQKHFIGVPMTSGFFHSTKAKQYRELEPSNSPHLH